LLPGAVRRRGGHPAAVVAATTGTPSGVVPEVGAPEQPVVEITLDAAAVPARGAYDTAAATRAPGGI
ncbi:MFS transporter, partial [Streptomyces sp. McG7]|nr:MFS transporter [Streptomyces sp. McG7]